MTKLSDISASPARSDSIDHHPADTEPVHSEPTTSAKSPTIDTSVASLPPPGLAINIVPATPNATPMQEHTAPSFLSQNGGAGRNSHSSDVRDQLGATGKRVQRILKHRVHQGTSRISTISKKVGSGVTAGLRRSNSTPGRETTPLLRPLGYQFICFHLRFPLGSSPDIVPSVVDPFAQASS